MRHRILTVLVLAVLGMPAARAASFTLEQVLGAPFASTLVAASQGRAFAWVSNAGGARNVWYAAAPTGAPRPAARVLTHYAADDGLEISDLAFVPHRDALLYVRGGDIEYPDKPAPNPAEIAGGVVQTVYVVDLRGGEPLKLGEGHAPVASPDGNRVLFLRDGVVYSTTPKRGASAEALFKVRGHADSLRFSPDGQRLAFVSLRGNHSFVGIYGFADRSVRWVDAGLSYDTEPRWSADGQQLAFVRMPYVHDEAGMLPHAAGSPWSIRVYSLASGRATEVWRAPEGRGSVFHPLSSDQQLYWSGATLVFPAETDGWLHLYAVPAAGGVARLLTPGESEVEYAAASADGAVIVYASNEGDIERRHLWRVAVAGGAPVPLTQGKGIETQPVVLGNGQDVAFLRADARVPMRAAWVTAGVEPVDYPAEGLPADFPTTALVEPVAVRLPDRAGIAAHGELFLPPADGRRHPAVIFMHGGPVRQMLAGWHYMDYYSNAYAMNQYLASRGYVVLALNYRSGIGYGLDFREAAHVGSGGASEYNDVLAAADLLAARVEVDATRIGLWGGSYGGYLTALGLARNSDRFAVGVDFHGVHDWNRLTITFRGGVPLYPVDAPPEALATSFESSPMSAVDHWRSPVLFIHGDDDHNVDFTESVTLAEALRARGVGYSELVFPDEIHGFLRHESWLRAYHATADFLDRALHP